MKALLSLEAIFGTSRIIYVRGSSEKSRVSRTNRRIMLNILITLHFFILHMFLFKQSPKSISYLFDDISK